MGFGAPGPVVDASATPTFPRPLEQRVVDHDRHGIIPGVSGHDRIGQHQSERVTRPAGAAEQSLRAAVMPRLIQPAPQHFHTPFDGGSARSDRRPTPHKNESRSRRTAKAADTGQQHGTVAPGRSTDHSHERGEQNRRCFPLHAQIHEPPRLRRVVTADRPRSCAAQGSAERGDPVSAETLSPCLPASAAGALDLAAATAGMIAGCGSPTRLPDPRSRAVLARAARPPRSPTGLPVS